MDYRDARELARIRTELKMRLMSKRQDGTAEILVRLKETANSENGSLELRNEYDRWRIRFDMLQ